MLSTPCLEKSQGLPRKGRSIQTAAELSLLLRIYRSQDKIQEAISILDSPLIGIKSELGRSSLDLMREKIELYELCNRWEDEWQFCRDLLESIRPSKTSGSQNPEYYWDDWKVWLGLITAAMNINTAE